MLKAVKSIWNEHREIVFILIMFLAIGLGYNLTVPLFESPAEGSHFRYARHIAEGQGLPLVPPDVQFPQEHQAPLYYLLTGALMSPLDLSGPALPQPNPYHVYNNPGPIEDNRNSYYHTQDEAFPYRGLILAVHLGRLAALFMGALTVLATYAVASELFSGLLPTPGTADGVSVAAVASAFPLHKTIALGSAAVNAFNPQFVFIANVMSNDTTAAACAGWSLFFAIRILRRGISWRRSLLLGISVGLAAISKLNGLAMLPIALLALAIAGLPLPARFKLRFDRPQTYQPAWRLWLIHTLLVCSLASLIAGWWYVRNWVLYRDPFTLKLAAERWSSGETHTFGQIISYWREIEVGFWGLFGHDNLLMDPLVYDVLHVIELLALVGLIIWGIRAWRYARRDDQWVWTMGFWAGLGLIALSFSAALVGLYRWLRVTDLPAGRYLYPAMSAISTLLFLGLSGLAPRRLTPFLAGAIGVGLLSLTLVAPFRYIGPAYSTPPRLNAGAVVPNQVDVSYAGRIKLVGYEIQEDTVRPGDWLHVTLYWQLLDPLDENLTVALRVLGQEGSVVGSKDTFPGLGRYPTSLWQPDIIIQDTYPVQIDFEAITPARLVLDVALYHQPTMFVLPRFDAMGNEISQLALGEARLISQSTELIEIPQETQFTLGQEIRLAGYALSEAPPRPPGSPVYLTLYWQPLTEPSVDYTVFIHLLDAESQVAASWDAPPVGGDYPTHLWSSEEIVEDVHALTLPPDLSPGDYRLVVGLYQLSTLQRLPAFDSQGQRVRDDAIPLLTLPVKQRDP